MLLEVLKVAVTRTTSIRDRRDADTKGKPIRLDAVVASVGMCFASRIIDMHVYVDQAGSDIQAASVDGLKRLRPINMVCNGCDFAVPYRYIPLGADVILGINDMSILEQ